MNRDTLHRFIRIIDEIAHDITDEVVMQIGSASYEPKNCTYFPFVPHQEYMEVFWKVKADCFPLCYRGHYSCDQVEETGYPVSEKGGVHGA